MLFCRIIVDANVRLETSDVATCSEGPILRVDVATDTDCLVNEVDEACGTSGLILQVDMAIDSIGLIPTTDVAISTKVKSQGYETELVNQMQDQQT